MSSSSSSSSSSLSTTLTTRRERCSTWTRCKADASGSLSRRGTPTETETSRAVDAGTDDDDDVFVFVFVVVGVRKRFYGNEERNRSIRNVSRRKQCVHHVEPTGPSVFNSYSPPTAFDEMVLQNKSMESKGTMVGVVALITGSTVGAGILALPSVCAETGGAFNLRHRWDVVAFIALGVVVSGDQRVGNAGKRRVTV